MEHEVCKNIPVIMMSSQDSISTVYKCMMRGAADYLVKPIRRNELSNLWQHVWRRKASTANGSQDERVAQQKIEATSENDAVSNHSNGNTACIQRNEDKIDKGSDAQENLEQIQNEIPTSDRSDLLDDALASYFGPDGNGRMRALGLGMTKTKHSILSERNDNLQALQDKCNKTEADVKELQEIISLLLKSQVSGIRSEDQSTANVHSVSVSTTLPKLTNKCKLLDWVGIGEVVAEGRLMPSDPKDLVHHVPLGPNAVRVWVDVAKHPDAFLWRPMSEMSTIEETISSNVA